MYNYIADSKYFKRNAAIALGNSGDRDMLPHLEKALHDEDELVRMHVAWAIGRLGGNEAKRILLSHLERENPTRLRRKLPLPWAANSNFENCVKRRPAAQISSARRRSITFSGSISRWRMRAMLWAAKASFN